MTIDLSFQEIEVKKYFCFSTKIFITTHIYHQCVPKHSYGSCKSTHFICIISNNTILMYGNGNVGHPLKILYFISMFETLITSSAYYMHTIYNSKTLTDLKMFYSNFVYKLYFCMVLNNVLFMA